MIDLTISIITENNKKLILDCLGSIYETTEHLKFEIYVVVNPSSDGSEAAIKEEFPEVKLIINQKKMGFTHNHNMVIKRSASRHILILNDDTVALDEAIDKMVNFMDAHPQIGILGCEILNPDGSLQRSCGKGLNHKFEYFKAGMLESFLPLVRHRHFMNTREVSWLAGACLLVRAQAIAVVGPFDENIIAYYEDGDWCYRMIQAGWKVVFYPQPKIIHYMGQTRKRNLENDTLIIYQSRFYFFAKHYSAFTFHFVRFLTMLEVITRYMKTLMSLYSSRGERLQKQELLCAYYQVSRLAWNSWRMGHECKKAQTTHEQ